MKRLYWIVIIAMVIGGGALQSGEDKPTADDEQKSEPIKVRAAPAVLRKNEANAIECLKVYAVAQSVFKKADYAKLNGLPSRSYSPTFAKFGKTNGYKSSSGTVHFIPDEFADATQDDPYEGYYFVDMKVDDLQTQFALCAVPARYGITGEKTFVIDQSGTVLAKDTGGETVKAVPSADDGWRERRPQRENEANAIASLKAYATAQTTFKKANYASCNGLPNHQYADTFAKLGGKNGYKNSQGKPIELLPSAMAEATKDKPFMGYYFVDLKSPHLMYDFGLCAVPAEYGATGTHTYVIGGAGTVLMKDTGGKPLTKYPDAADVEDWLVP